jgi:hypothetical protein
MDQLEGTLSLVQRSQDGDELAITELIGIIRDFHMPRYVGRYYGRNVVVSDDEIESEFLLGVWKALPKAKLDVGNPLNFMCWRGQKAVQTLMRNNIRRETRYQCLECSNTGTMAYKLRVPVCGVCGTDDIYTWMIETAHPVDSSGDSLVDSSLYGVGVTAETAWQLAVYGIQIEEIRERLNGRVLELFDIIVLEGVNRDSSKNYLREVAERWGVSQMRVVHALRKLRIAIEVYYAEAEEC